MRRHLHLRCPAIPETAPGSWDPGRSAASAGVGVGEQRVSVRHHRAVWRGRGEAGRRDAYRRRGPALRFEVAAGKTFLLNALEVLGPDDAELEILFPDAPSDILPAVRRSAGDRPRRSPRGPA